LTVRTDQIASIRDAEDSEIVAIGDVAGEKVLAARGRLIDFRAAYGFIERRDGGVALSSDCADLLGLSVGDKVTHVARG
jgi:arginine N-succinyltransferase